MVTIPALLVPAATVSMGFGLLAFAADGFQVQDLMGLGSCAGVLCCIAMFFQYLRSFVKVQMKREADQRAMFVAILRTLMPEHDPRRETLVAMFEHRPENKDKA